MAHRLGVDVGGTFTDLLLVHDESGAMHRVKTPSTPGDPSEGVLVGVRRISDEAGTAVADIRNILHGTTVATNAVLESKGARVGLLTTVGFKQILHLARSQTPGPLAGWIIMIKPDPPASLADTREIVERMDARGNTVTPVDMKQAEEAIRDLVESGVETLTIGFINSYISSRHEEEVGEIVERLYPGFPVTLSLACAAGVPGVRADADRVHELVRAAEGGELRRAPPVGAEIRRRHGGRQHPPLGRGADDDARGGAEPDLRRPLRAVRRRRRRALRGAQGRLRQHPHLRHGWDVNRRVALPRWGSDDRARDGDQPFPPACALRRRPHRGRRRRVDRPRAGADEGPARRPAVGRRRAGSRRVRKGRHRPDRHRRERRRRPPPPSAARRRDAARRGGRADGGADDRRCHGPAVGRRRGRGHPRHRQREHGRGAAGRLRPARPRPARVRARCLWRGGADARERRRADHGLVPGDRAPGAGPSLRARGHRGGLPRRVRPHLHPRARRRRAGGRRRASSRSSASGPSNGSRTRASPRSCAVSATWPICAITARVTRSP